MTVQTLLILRTLLRDPGQGYRGLELSGGTGLQPEGGPTRCCYGWNTWGG